MGWGAGGGVFHPPPPSNLRTNGQREVREVEIESSHQVNSKAVLNFHKTVKCRVMVRSKVKADSCFALSAAEARLEAAANPNSAKAFLNGWRRWHTNEELF